METVIIGVIRTLCSGLLAALLVFTLSRPKYGKRVIGALLAAICLIDIGTSIYFYLQNDLTGLARFDTLLFCLVGIAAKPFFHDTPMQWLFNYTTALNMYCATLVISYLVSRVLPYPMVGNILIRAAILTTLIFIFLRFLRPLYRQVAERWSIFFLLTLAMLLNFSFYLLRGDDIERTLIENAAPLLLLILVMVLIYATIFCALRTLSREYELRSENVRIQLHQTMLDAELVAAQDYVRFARQSRHDMRHHDAIVLEYLDQGSIQEAQAYLEQHARGLQENALRIFCENQTANAIFHLYEQRCLSDSIDITVHAIIPRRLSLPNPALGALLSNILENAWKACRTEKEKGNAAHLSVSAEIDEYDRLTIEVRNTTSCTIQFEKGTPLRGDGSKGTGTQSVEDIVGQCEGMVRFSQQDNTFLVQIVLPLPPHTLLP
ncbi:MAG: GHKL domain-containing protein [Gordonibacter sp.]|nr:GHKL domain-containing protein [Gordonibacter sp.]